MQDWIMTTLASVRRVAAESGYANLADELDVALLVAAQESLHHGGLANTDGADVGGAGRDSGEVVYDSRFVGSRRYH